MKSYKIVLVGNAGTGKSCFLERITNGRFVHSYIPTLRVDIKNVTLDTNLGKFELNVWCISGQERFNAKDKYPGADGFIVFFDFGSKTSYYDAQSWINEIREVCPSAKCVLVGNKSELSNRKIMLSDVRIHRRYRIPFYPISAKSTFNMTKPLLGIIQELHGDENLHLVN